MLVVMKYEGVYKCVRVVFTTGHAYAVQVRQLGKKHWSTEAEEISAGTARALFLDKVQTDSHGIANARERAADDAPNYEARA